MEKLLLCRGVLESEKGDILITRVRCVAKIGFATVVFQISRGEGKIAPVCVCECEKERRKNTINFKCGICFGKFGRIYI